MMESMMKRSHELQTYMTDIRRSLHRFPETGWLEMRTSAIIAKELEEMGYAVITGRAVCEESARMGVPDRKTTQAHLARALAHGLPEEYLTQDMREGFTGVVGVLACGEGPVVAMRFDIDALGMQEWGDDTHRPTREGFASVIPGRMHACGHDAHTAMLLGAAKLMKYHEQELGGIVKFMFQPAEEILEGAKDMIDAGVLENPKADGAMMVHVMTGVPIKSGTVIVSAPGVSAPAADFFKIEIKGKGYRKEDGTRGNLIVNTEIVIPTSLTNEEKDVLKKLNEITKFNPRSKT